MDFAGKLPHVQMQLKTGSRYDSVPYDKCCLGVKTRSGLTRQGNRTLKSDLYFIPCLPSGYAATNLLKRHPSLISRCVEAPFVVLTNKGELLFLLCDLDLKRVVVKIATLGFDLDRYTVPLA